MLEQCFQELGYSGRRRKRNREMLYRMKIERNLQMKQRVLHEFREETRCKMIARSFQLHCTVSRTRPIAIGFIESLKQSRRQTLVSRHMKRWRIKQCFRELQVHKFMQQRNRKIVTACFSGLLQTSL